jgi:hypothetical protein
MNPRFAQKQLIKYFWVILKSIHRYFHQNQHVVIVCTKEKVSRDPWFTRKATLHKTPHETKYIQPFSQAIPDKLILWLFTLHTQGRDTKSAPQQTIERKTRVNRGIWRKKNTYLAIHHGPRPAPLVKSQRSNWTGAWLASFTLNCIVAPWNIYIR